ncbi:MAG: hypothetical protein JNN27_14880 [Planctomycetes bacterium]|nr:hypothetical protein [Planctomycetota bacterium]
MAPVEVWWWQPEYRENSQELGQRERWLKSGEVDARLAELARKLEPDALGTSHSPEPYATGCVVARGEDLWGWTRVQRSSPDPTYVPLESDETVRVRGYDSKRMTSAGAGRRRPGGGRSARRAHPSCGLSSPAHASMGWAGEARAAVARALWIRPGLLAGMSHRRAACSTA